MAVMGDAAGLGRGGGEEGCRAGGRGTHQAARLDGGAGRPPHVPPMGPVRPAPTIAPVGCPPTPAACSPGPRSSSQPPPPRWTSPFFPALSPASASRRARGTLCVHGCARVACGAHVRLVETRNPDSYKRRIRGPSPTRPLHLFQRRSFAVRCTSASWATRQAEPQSARPRVRTCAQARGSCRTWACGAPRDAVARSRPAAVRVSGSFPPASVHVRAPIGVPGHLLERKRASPSVWAAERPDGPELPLGTPRVPA